MLVNKKLYNTLITLYEYVNAIVDKQGKWHNEYSGKYERKSLSFYLGCENKKYITNNLNDLLGAEYFGFKGQEAVDKIFKEKKGHIKNAFFRPNIGNISICWGDDTCGLRHIILRRYKKKQDIIKVIGDIGKTIENGKITAEEDKYIIKHKNIKIILSTNLKNEKLTAVISGMEI